MRLKLKRLKTIVQVDNSIQLSPHIAHFSQLFLIRVGYFLRMFKELDKESVFLWRICKDLSCEEDIGTLLNFFLLISSHDGPLGEHHDYKLGIRIML